MRIQYSLLVPALALIGSVSPAQVGSTSSNPCGSCAELLQNGTFADGIYWIDPDGPGGNPPYEVFCDMTLNGGGWTVLFNSSDPSLWGTNSGTPGTGQWSHDFSSSNIPIDQVYIRRTDTGQFQSVSGIAAADLYACAAGAGGWYWNGSLTNTLGAQHLGIHNTTIKNPAGYVVVGEGCVSDTQGYGFGHTASVNQQGWGWDSNDLGTTTFTIGVRESTTQVVSAVQTSRVGSPANPSAFQPGTQGPVQGQSWNPFVDHSAFAPTAIADFMAISIQGVTNFPSALGTLLILPPFEGPVIFSPAPSTPFAISIPTTCSFLGVQVWTQAGSVSAGPVIELANALDLVIGNS